MTENLQKWIDENKLLVSESQLGDSDIISIEGVGKFLYLKPFEEKVIDEDFAFILSDEEFDLLDEKKVDSILFEFGGKFFHSGLKKDKNKYNEMVYKPEFKDFKYLGKSSEEFIADFAHLGVHSEYEILNGSGGCSLWAEKAKFLGVSAIGICDKNTLSGTLSFQSFCEKFKVKPIIGETIDVARNYNPKLDNQEIFELKLYVLNKEGWKNLLLINKEINVTYNGFIPSDILYLHGSGLCCVVPTNSEFNQFITDRKEAVKLIKQYKKTFDLVYYQIDTVRYFSDTLFKRHLSNIDNYIINYKDLFSPIVINDSYYLDAEEGGLKSLLNKVAGVAHPESDNQYFKTVGETIGAYEEWFDSAEPLFEAIMLGIRKAHMMSQSVNFVINTGDRKMPKFEVKDVESLFFSEIQKGFEERLGHLSEKEKLVYLERLEIESEVIVPNELCDYFMILWDIMKYCRDNGIMVGSGRGSVCGSLIAYLLHITDVDPLIYDLLFERFLNEARVKIEGGKARSDQMPDIDADFPTERREKVKNYICEKYGESFTCSIGTFGRMKLKTCLKDFGKVKGLPFDKMNALTKDIDDQIDYTWGDLIEYACKSKSLFKFIQEYPEIVHMTKYALQQCKASSIHPSALIIVPKYDFEGTPTNLFEWMPVKSINGVLVSEWEGKYVDKSGFLKEDILGLSQLDKFQTMMSSIKANHGIDIDVTKIPFDDEEVFKYFRRGWCEDVFQFGTMGLMNYCRQVKPTCLDDLIAMTALFRPGPMESNAHVDFADIKNGKKKPKYDFGLKEVTESTFGLYVYQEQIMKAVNVLGGLTLVEADGLRTIMKKKDKAGMLAMSTKFIAGAIKNGCPAKEAEAVWEKLDKFSGYGFNKSHAAAYTIMSYWSQWFKVNYPLEFWTTSFQYSKEQDIPFRISELKKTGVALEIRPPDVNFSSSNFTCDPKENRIFFSITKIKGLGTVAVENIIATRNEGGEFYSVEEFISIVPSKVNKTVVKNLIISGAFDLLEHLDNPRERKLVLKNFLESKNDKLPDEYETPESDSNSFWVFEQKNLTGFGEVDYQTMIKDAIPSKRISELYVDGLEFANAKEGTEVAIAGKVIAYTERDIKNGKMCTLQMDCNNAVIEVSIWPDTWIKIGEEAANLRGKVIVFNGRAKKNSYKGQKVLYSDDRSRLFIIS